MKLWEKNKKILANSTANGDKINGHKCIVTNIICFHLFAIDEKLLGSKHVKFYILKETEINRHKTEIELTHSGSI